MLWAGLLAAVDNDCSKYTAYAAVNNYGYSSRQQEVDSFHYEYGMKMGDGRSRKYSWDFYAGFTGPTYLVKSTRYRQLVYGSSVTDTIGLARVNDQGVFYIDSLTASEKPLLLFGKNVNDTWKVDIEDTYLYKKLIVFEGEQQIDGELVYVYSVKDEERPLVSGGNDIVKIYYSREKGFVKLLAQTHWGRTDMTKKKPG